MLREPFLHQVQTRREPWDIIVVGGCATGMGTALDAASRGYSVLLLEQSDFGKGTSSRSTKLVHGGVRYLQQGNVSLVMEALKERGILFQNAPHLVHDLPFVVPNYQWWETPFYGIGLKVFELALDIPTADITEAAAMEEAACAATIAFGMEAIAGDVDVLCLGEMGIGNTTVASAVYAALYGGDPRQWVGRGTGVDDEGLARKVAPASGATVIEPPSGPIELTETAWWHPMRGTDPALTWLRATLKEVLGR